MPLPSEPLETFTDILTEIWWPLDRALVVELDTETPTGEHRRVERRVPVWVPWLVLAAIFFTYINIGTYWTYIELATIDAGIDNEYVGRLLVWTSFFSLVGCAAYSLLVTWGYIVDDLRHGTTFIGTTCLRLLKNNNPSR